MKKLIAILLGFVFFLYLIPLRVFADSNFTSNYNVTYNVLENALTHVAFNITLTNKTNKYYASSYSIQVGFKDVENVLVTDSAGKITPQTTKNNNGSNIEINFNDRVVGLNNRLNFSISFDTKDIAQKSGKIWDINIPGLSEQKDYDSFNVNVIVPKFLGNPSYIKPNIGNFTGTNLNFTKEELGNSGISISFGDAQIYNFNLSYHLRNSNLFSIETEIALPPSTNYQDVQINSIEPKPENVIQDIDGNWLAQYILTPGKKIDITVKGYAKIMLTPKKKQLTDSELKEYLKEQPYWQSNNKDIIDLALKLKTPYAIYQYVTNTLTYDFNRAQVNKPRMGAYAVLKDPKSAVCLEFTDLFIALARAANIPAREINGYAYAQNPIERPLSLVKDILHAWPEYYDYDLQTWVMIDPTWGNTTSGVDYFHTLDFDHFAFIIKGASSTYPIPAGGYKTSDNNATHDINVGFGDNFTSQAQILSLSTDLASEYFSGFSPKGNIVIKNDGQIISLPQEITVNTNFLTPKVQKIPVGKIPPFGFIVIPISFDKPSFLTNKTDIVKIALNENYISKEIKITPFILNKWTVFGGYIVVVIIAILSFTIYKIRNLSVSKQEK